MPNGRPGINPIKLIIINLLRNDVFLKSDFLITVQFADKITARYRKFFTGQKGGFDFVKLGYLGSQKGPELGYLFIS